MKPRTLLCLLALLSALGGCATRPDGHPSDPFEPWNRGVSSFNESVDQAVLKPVATAYQDVAPSFVRTGVGNFFGNLRDIWSMVNAILQLRPEPALENGMRVGVNTVFGFGGLIDLASEMQIPRTKLDFGLTLGRWGVSSGPYLVLPVLGPSTVRDTAGVVVDMQADPLGEVKDIPARNTLMGVRATDDRARLLGATNLLEDVALDPYTFTRDAYLQRRRYQVDGARGVDATNEPEDDAR